MGLGGHFYQVVALCETRREGSDILERIPLNDQEIRLYALLELTIEQLLTLSMVLYRLALYERSIEAVMTRPDLRVQANLEVD